MCLYKKWFAQHAQFQSIDGDPKNNTVNQIH